MSDFVITNWPANRTSVYGIRGVLEEDPEALAVGDQPFELGNPVMKFAELAGGLLGWLGVVDHYSMLPLGAESTSCFWKR